MLNERETEGERKIEKKGKSMCKKEIEEGREREL